MKRCKLVAISLILLTLTACGGRSTSGSATVTSASQSVVNQQSAGNQQQSVPMTQEITDGASMNSASSETDSSLTMSLRP